MLRLPMGDRLPSFSSVLSAVGVSAVGACLVKHAWDNAKKKGKPLPPGPKGMPIIGNLLDLSLERPWEYVTNIAQEFGNIIHFGVAGQHLIYLNDFQTCIDLLDKRSSIYSDRSLTTMVELMDVERMTSLTRYGEEWRRARRLFHQEFNSVAFHKYLDFQLEYAHALVYLLRDYPSDFEQHINHFASGTILEAMYGFRIQPIQDPFVSMIQEASGFIQGLLPGTYLVDAFPFLKYLPAWVPGPNILGTRLAKDWRKLAEHCTMSPFQATVRSIDSGTAKPSFISSWLSRLKDMPDGGEKEKSIKSIRDVAITAFLGGYETTSSILLNFTLAMVKHPDTQSKAQAELDRVIGRERLPDLSDKENLPYTVALYKEVLRWAPVAPLGIPHSVIEEDEYNGMRIPKKSIILSNIWSMTRNEKEYGHDVEAFKPDRLFQTNALDPTKYIFGFGRRICPGRHLGESGIFIAICHILHLFTITRVVNENGVVEPLNPEWVSGLTVHLKPFPATFLPRFEGADKLIDSCRASGI